ncbi:MAG: AraC family transcriptional regulator [Clostridiales bacterium]|nr:AraC family transcriptional regulator [Clostridiales bacterium]
MENETNINPHDNYFQNEKVRSFRCIYTPSAFARSSLLYLQETGTLTSLKPHVSSRANLQSYLFFVVVEGSGWLSYENVKYEIGAGDCVFIPCVNGYSQSSSDDLWKLKWCHFNSAQLSSLWNKYCERGGKPVFRPSDESDGTSGAAVFSSLLDELYVIASSEDFVRDIHINEQLTKLVTGLMEQTVYDENKRDRNGVRSSDRITTWPDRIGVGEVKGYIDTHYKEPLSLEGLAEKCYVNKNYLARIFKETYGLTVGGYIQLVRIGKAKEMLRFSEKTIEAVSIECGYGGDSNYFSRVFKKVEGCSPSSFRKNRMSNNTN